MGFKTKFKEKAKKYGKGLVDVGKIGLSNLSENIKDERARREKDEGWDWGF